MYSLALISMIFQIISTYILKLDSARCNRAPVNFSDAYMLFAAKNKRNLPPSWYFVLQSEIVRHIS